MKQMNKRGQVINIISGSVISFLALILIIFAVLFGVSALNPSSFFTAGSANANVTTAMVSNLTSGVSNVTTYIPTVFIILGVVLALSAILLLIVFVRRMQAGGGGGTL